MISEDLHTRFSVGVVSRFELQPVETETFEERVEYADEVCEPEAAVCDHAFHLVELCQMRRVQSLVTEYLYKL